MWKECMSHDNSYKRRAQRLLCSTNIWLILFLLLLRSIEIRGVYRLSNVIYVYLLKFLLPCLCFSWSPSLCSFMIVAVFLFSSYRSVSTCSTNYYLPFYGSVHTISIRIDCSTCILLLMVCLGFYFCNLDTLADLK